MFELCKSNDTKKCYALMDITDLLNNSFIALILSPFRFSLQYS